MKAAVVYATNTPVHVEEIEVLPPRAGEVLVRVANAGVCHSDLHVITGQLPATMPVVLGHEGSGVIEAVGADVTAVKPGDHVILLWRTSCNRCSYCARGRPALCDAHAALRGKGTMLDGTYRFRKDGQDLNCFSLCSCMAEYTVMYETAVLPIEKDIPLPVAALVGCAVMTGVGAVLNTARVEEGASVAVFGVGGVGLCVVMGAVLANASQVIAVDLKANKLEYARGFGATDVVDASQEDPVDAIRRLTGGRGVAYAFEAIGVPRVMEQAFRATMRGGTTVVIGAAPIDASISISPSLLFAQERTLKGSLYGSFQPWYDMPRLLDLYRRGKLPLDRLISRTYPLGQVNEAFTALDRGEVARSVLSIGAA